MNERGHAAVELALAVAVLMLPVALVVTGFGPWSERRVLAEAAAAESARAVVLELDHRAGVAAVTAITANHGLSADQVRLGWCGATPVRLNQSAGMCPLTRGSVVSATVQVWVPLVNTPWGAIGGIWITADHVEPIDLYRSLR